MLFVHKIISNEGLQSFFFPLSVSTTMSAHLEFSDSAAAVLYQGHLW